MKRRDFVAGGLAGTLASPALAQGQAAEWKNAFIDKWVKGAWLATFSDAKIRPVQMEFYSYSPSVQERGTFVLRMAAAWPSDMPEAIKSGYARPTANGAEVGYAGNNGKVVYKFNFTASDTQQGVRQWLPDNTSATATLRRLSSAELDAQRTQMLKGERPALINASYFG